MFLVTLHRIFGKSDAFDAAAVVIKAVRRQKDVMMQQTLINKPQHVSQQRKED